MTRRTWLETTEYGLVLVSLVGTVVAAVSQQVVVAVLPLSLALLVNLLQRTQWEASQQQWFLSVVESWNQRYSADMKFLRRRLQEVLLSPQPVNLTPLEHSLQELHQALVNLHQEMDQRLATVEGLDLAPLHAQLTQLQDQYQMLRSGLGELSQNLVGLPSSQQIAHMEKGLGELQRQAAQLQTQVQQLRQTPVVDVQPLEAQLAYLSQHITASQALSAQINTLETATQRLQQAVEQLGQEVAATLQVRETVGRLERELRSHSQLAPLVHQLEQQLRQVLTRYQQQEQLTQGLAQALRQLQAQQEQLATWESRLRQIEALHAQVTQLQQQARTHVSRTALLPLVTAVTQLHRQQTTQAQQLAPLVTTLTTMQQELAQLQHAPEPAALEPIRTTLADLTQQINTLSQQHSQALQQVKQELSRTQAQLTQLKDFPQLQQQLNEMAQLVSQLDHSHGDLRESTQTLASRQAQIEQQWQTTQAQLQHLPEQINTAIQDWATAINRQLRHLPNYTYELVADRFGGREVLTQALAETTQELIIVSPWLSQQGIDRPFLQALRRLLTQGVQVHIGWGDVQDLKNQELSRNKNNQWRDGPGRFSWKYNALGDLEQLEREFPQHLHLKFIGTREHYLVSDDRFALVGSHALLGGSGASREVSLKTTDPRLIQDLRKRFQRAANLDDLNC